MLNVLWFGDGVNLITVALLSGKRWGRRHTKQVQYWCQCWGD